MMMLAMDNAAQVIGSYAVTFVALGLFVWRMFAGARRSASQVSPEERPWT